MAWAVSGTYLESCNCDAICPCRRIGGRAGGRSTHGVCTGALSWLIETGHFEGLDLSGLAAVLSLRYDDDEPGSPWDFYLYVDERADAPRRDALADIFLGRAGGTALEHFPWVWKPSNLLGVAAAPIELDHTPGRGRIRARDRVSVRVRAPVPDQEPVTCVIPGHHRAGRELVVEELRLSDGPFAVELDGVCAYEGTFAYESRAQPEQPGVS